jgi:hypothetical protein
MELGGQQPSNEVILGPVKRVRLVHVDRRPLCWTMRD